MALKNITSNLGVTITIALTMTVVLYNNCSGVGQNFSRPANQPLQKPGEWWAPNTINERDKLSINDNQFELLGAYGRRFQDVYLNSHNAYFADSRGLSIYNIEDPSRPRFLGQLVLAGDSERITGRDNLVFVSTSYNGVNIVDVSDPRAPRLLAKVFEGDRYGKRMATSDQSLIVLSIQVNSPVTNSIEVLDITEPSSPQLKGTFPADDWFTVQDNSLYFLFEGNLYQMDLIDLNALTPELLGPCPTTGEPTVLGDHLYFFEVDEVGDNVKMKAYGLNDLAAPPQETVIYQLPKDLDPYAIFSPVVKSSKIYLDFFLDDVELEYRAKGVLVVEPQKGAPPVVTSPLANITEHSNNGHFDVSAEGVLIQILTGNAVKVWDINNLNSPVEFATETGIDLSFTLVPYTESTKWFCRKIIPKGDVFGNRNCELQYLEEDWSFTPSHVFSDQAKFGGHQIIQDRYYAAAPGSNTVNIYEILGKDRNPVLLSTVDHAPHSWTSMHALGGHLYLIGKKELAAETFMDVLAKVSAENFSTGLLDWTLEFPEGLKSQLTLDGDFLYVVTPDEVQVFDVSVDSPVRVGGGPTPGVNFFSGSIIVKEDRFYSTQHAENYLNLFDLGASGGWTLAGQFSLTAGTNSAATGIAGVFSNQVITSGDFYNGIEIFDVSDPANIVKTHTHFLPYRPSHSRIDHSSRLMYINGNAGSAIYRIK